MELLTEELEEIIRKARRRGVRKPLSVITDYIGAKNLNEVRLFGIRAGILFTFASPTVLYLLKIYCVSNHLEISLPESNIMNFALFNAGSVMAFGFGSTAYTYIRNKRFKLEYESEANHPANR